MVGPMLPASNPSARAAARYGADCTAALETALADVPFYERWRPLDPGPGTPIHARFAALPVLTKRDTRAHMPRGFIPKGRDFRAGLESGELELVATSGTTEDRNTIAWHQPWWDASELAAAGLHHGLGEIITGRQREAVLTTPLCAGTVCHAGDLPMAERTLGRLLFLNQKSDPNFWTPADLDRMLDELRQFQPELLEADPAYLAVLARHAVRQGAAVPAPRFVSLTYEFPSHVHYRAIRRLFPDTPVLSSYGSTETGHVFTECEHGRFHQNAAFCRVDFQPLREAHGGPCAGRILVSMLRNPWVSLLRFDVGDLVRLADAPCPCGRALGLTLESVEGRTRDLTFDARGRAVTVGQLDRQLAAVEGLLSYQVEQPAPLQYRIRFVAAPGTESRVGAQAADRLRSLYGAAAEIVPRPESAIAAEPSGKFRLARTLFAWDAGPLFVP
jgi:phenylacetate-CoA ligase